MFLKQDAADASLSVSQQMAIWYRLIRCICAHLGYRTSLICIQMLNSIRRHKPNIFTIFNLELFSLRHICQMLEGNGLEYSRLSISSLYSWVEHACLSFLSWIYIRLHRQQMHYTPYLFLLLFVDYLFFSPSRSTLWHWTWKFFLHKIRKHRKDTQWYMRRLSLSVCTALSQACNDLDMCLNVCCECVYVQCKRWFIYSRATVYCRMMIVYQKHRREAVSSIVNFHVLSLAATIYSCFISILTIRYLSFDRQMMSSWMLLAMNSIAHRVDPTETGLRMNGIIDMILFICTRFQILHITSGD